MILVMIRTIILFILVVIALRIMGKRQIGKLQPYELVIIIMLAELASLPMADNRFPLVIGVVAIITLAFVEVFISYTALKSQHLREFICGSPSILIENGKILEQELTRLRYNVNDLLEQLRTKNFPDIADVEYAILETSGEISVIPKSQKRPLSPADLHIPTEYEGLPITLVIDGFVFVNNLQKINLSEQWLSSELSKFGIHDLKQVLLATLDTQGNLFYQLKTQKA
ncbi:DUF421 domain-containing protein [Desulfotomaculum defluvii]